MTAWRRGHYCLCYCVKQWGILSPRIPKGARGTLPPRTQGTARRSRACRGVCERSARENPVRRGLKGQRRVQASPMD